MEYGIVYLLTNPVMPGLVKIGMTTQVHMGTGTLCTKQIDCHRRLSSIIRII